MKLLIDIPKEIYELIVNDKDKLIGLAGAVQNSIPLERIKSEIRKKIIFNSFNEGIVKYDDILEIIDKNVESEESMAESNDNTRPYYANE